MSTPVIADPAAAASGEPEVTLVRMAIRANRRLLSPVCAFVRETATQCGVESAQAHHLELLSEELCLVVIEQAFDGRSDETFDLSVGFRPGCFVLRVEDKGQPFDLDGAERSGLTDVGMRMLKALCDDIDVENLGKKGLRITLLKRLNLPPLEDTMMIDLAPAPAIEGAQPPRSETPVVLRDMQPGDAVAFSRCMHNTYGLTYRDVVYFPERIVDRLLSESLYSRVAVTPDGEVVAHHGLGRHPGTGPVAEFTMGVVDPRFRGRGIFEKLKAEAIARIAERGIRGLYAECVTLHAFSQRANFHMGARETGFMLNNVSGARHFRGIGGGEVKRQHIAWLYLKIADHPEQILHVPEAHADMIGQICAHAGLPRQINTKRSGGMPAGATALHIEPDTDGGLAVISVTRIGGDLAARVRGALDRLSGYVAAVYLDLPLTDPATPDACAAMEARGWSFALLAPEYGPEGDMLRLQWLNAPLPAADEIATVSPFGEALRDYVITAARAADGIRRQAA